METQNFLHEGTIDAPRFKQRAQEVHTTPLGSAENAPAAVKDISLWENDNVRYV